MLISEALTAAAALTGQSVDADAAVRWLSELDGRLAFELFGADAWTPYDATDDLGAALLVPFPWDGLYPHHLEALVYFTDGEYDRYEPARALSEQILTDYRAFLRRSRGRPVLPAGQSGGSAVTVITPRAHSPFHWLSAYALAVRHGFAGTEEAWLASLVGPKGDPGDIAPLTAATGTSLSGVLTGDGSHLGVRAVDAAPAQGSAALITSGGVYAAIQSAVGAAMGGSY